ncbi:hypothetical protein J6590_010954 [Homalodisca vitripennis]|nr:hypothetical protein J6590_010954 [Homalodisca vitripennis]
MKSQHGQTPQKDNHGYFVENFKCHSITRLSVCWCGGWRRGEEKADWLYIDNLGHSCLAYCLPMAVWGRYSVSGGYLFIKLTAVPLDNEIECMLVWWVEKGRREGRLAVYRQLGPQLSRVLLARGGLGQMLY